MTGGIQSRTTSSNAWLPPPESGTVSQKRADRWTKTERAEAEKEAPAARPQGSAKGAKGSPSPRNKKVDTRRERGVSATSATSFGASSGVSTAVPASPNSISPQSARHRQQNQQQDDELDENEDELKSEPEDDEQLRDIWFHGGSGGNPAGGDIRSYMSETTQRTGMSHPPQSEYVQNQLLAYFKADKVPHKKKPSRSTSLQGAGRQISQVGDDDDDDSISNIMNDTMFHGQSWPKSPDAERNEFSTDKLAQTRDRKKNPCSPPPAANTRIGAAGSVIAQKNYNELLDCVNKDEVKQQAKKK